MPYTTAGKNKMLDALGATHAAVYNGDPSGAGTQNGARQAITWAAAAAGAKDSSSQPVFNLTSGQTVTHVAFFDAATAGNMLAYADVVDETFGADGTYTLTDADLDLNA